MLAPSYFCLSMSSNFRPSTDLALIPMRASANAKICCPQTGQNRWSRYFLAKRYEVRSESSPDVNVTEDCGVKLSGCQSNASMLTCIETYT